MTPPSVIARLVPSEARELDEAIQSQWEEAYDDTKKSQLYRQSAGKDVDSYHSLSAKPGIANADYASYRHNQITT